jgi:Ca2+-binding RTX toxin-like protein
MQGDFNFVVVGPRNFIGNWLDTVADASTLALSGFIGGTLDDLTEVFGDHFVANAGNDFILAGIGKDLIEGGKGSATLNGGEGGDGADLLTDSARVDTLSYAGAGVAVVVNLVTGSASGGAGVDTLSGFVHALGSIFADTLRGNAADNLLDGRAGNDSLLGLNGDDSLRAGAGDDVIQDNSGELDIDGGVGNDPSRFLPRLRGRFRVAAGRMCWTCPRPQALLHCNCWH